MNQTSQYADCSHFDAYTGLSSEILVCREGHRPRFYKPRNALDTDYGWKRRCDKFKAVLTQQRRV